MVVTAVYIMSGEMQWDPIWWSLLYTLSLKRCSGTLYGVTAVYIMSGEMYSLVEIEVNVAVR